MANKSDLAYAHLRQSIITAEIPPDAPMRIQALGQSTGYGSTPVREALRRLEAERLVVSAENCGFRSAPVSIDQLKDLEQSRMVIETALLRDAMARGGDDWEGEIIAAHHQLSKLEPPIDSPVENAQNTWNIRHQKFHDALLSAAASYWLKSFYSQICEQLVRHYHHTLEGSLRHKFENDEQMKAILRQVLGIDHHTALMKATLDRDTDKAVALLEEHIQFASKTFSSVFS